MPDEEEMVTISKARFIELSVAEENLKRAKDAFNNKLMPQIVDQFVALGVPREKLVHKRWE